MCIRDSTEHNARDIGCFVRCQEHKCIGNILRLTQAAQRDLLDERINYFLGNSLHHIGQGNTGSDCIHSNTLRTQFSGKGNRQAIDSKFGCGISKATGLTVNADH